MILTSHLSGFLIFLFRLQEKRQLMSKQEEMEIDIENLLIMSQCYSDLFTVKPLQIIS